MTRWSKTSKTTSSSASSRPASNHRRPRDGTLRREAARRAQRLCRTRSRADCWCTGPTGASKLSISPPTRSMPSTMCASCSKRPRPSARDCHAPRTSTGSKTLRGHEEAAKDKDFRAVFWLNQEFHELQYSCCGNPRLAELIGNHARVAQPIRVVKYDDDDHMKSIVSQHFDIIAAMRGTSTKHWSTRCAPTFPHRPRPIAPLRTPLRRTRGIRMRGLQPEQTGETGTDLAPATAPATRERLGGPCATGLGVTPRRLANLR